MTEISLGEKLEDLSQTIRDVTSRITKLVNIKIDLQNELKELCPCETETVEKKYYDSGYDYFAETHYIYTCKICGTTRKEVDIHKSLGYG